ncbi:MAG: crossover junction endodeoxyribonuclease RuvC, partial [Actinobacteria bacterium]|nr:crossover junction endodeoxyribonuclease RuvC [Actinomycetota bacterium]
MLGIDPGLTRCGFAVVRPDAQPELVSLGVLATPASDELPSRLAHLQRDLEALFDEYAPAAVAVERVFFQHNTRTAMSVGQASGIVLALAASRGCVVAQYTPTQVKNTVAKTGCPVCSTIGIRLRLISFTTATGSAVRVPTSSAT